MVAAESASCGSWTLEQTTAFNRRQPAVGASNQGAFRGGTGVERNARAIGTPNRRPRMAVEGQPRHALPLQIVDENVAALVAGLQRQPPAIGREPGISIDAWRSQQGLSFPGTVQPHDGPPWRGFLFRDRKSG